MEIPKTDEEVIEFAKVYCLHELIKKYFETKNSEVLEEINKLCKNSISQTE